MQCIICFTPIQKPLFVYDPSAHVCEKCVNALAQDKKIVIVIEDDSTADNLKRTGDVIYASPDLINNEHKISYIFKSEYNELIKQTQSV